MDAGVRAIATAVRRLDGGAVGVALVSTIAAASISGSETSGFTSGYLACAVVAAVAAVVALGLVPGGKPHAVAGHGHGVAQGH
jgi:hypothetical protein